MAQLTFPIVPVGLVVDVLPWLSQGSLVVMELAPGFPFDVLLG
jgi:hypothetical protein